MFRVVETGGSLGDIVARSRTMAWISIGFVESDSVPHHAATIAPPAIREFNKEFCDFDAS